MFLEKAWENDLIAIREENVDRISVMDGKMWDQLYPIVEYLGASSIPLFEKEVIKKELIGMAEEAQIEEITLEEKLGMPGKEFCDQILQSQEKTDRRKSGEYLVEFVAHFVWILTFFTMETLWTNQLDLDMSDFLEAAVFAALSLWIHDLVFVHPITDVMGKFAFCSKKVQAGLIALLILILILGDWVIWKLDINIIISGIGRIYFVGMLVLSYLMMLVRKRYWNSRSKEYGWHNEKN